MGVEMIKDRQGRDHLVLSDEDFYNDDIMGNKFEDYEILQVFSNGPDYGFTSKVRSKFNSKIYAMKKIDLKYGKKELQQNINQEFILLSQMNFPNITKYFKYFFQDSYLYVVFEFVNNSDLGGFLDAYKSLGRPIDQNTLWNIFMQCISALNYIHNNNIIHMNISLTNIFMTESKIVKLGDFRFSFLVNDPKLIKKDFLSPEMVNNLHYNKKTDVYALGSLFHQLCYFCSPNDKSQIKNKNLYPTEMVNIIQLMLKPENERPDARLLYELIMDQYIKNVAKITSIDSVFRCMFAFQNFNQEMNQRAGSFSNVNITPISFNFVNCLQRYFTGENQRENSIYLNNFRNLLYNNSQVNNEIEIKPSVVLDYLLEKLNKETGNNFNGPSLGIQTSNFNQDKDASLRDFIAYFKNNFNSIISKYFVGVIKTKRICKTCRDGLYSFNLFPFIEFDLDICGQDSNLPNWFNTQNNNCLDLTAEHNVVCQNCRCVREHHEFKQFFSLPQNFIISLNRGEGFKNKAYVQFPIVLDLTQKIEKGDSPCIFNLVGVIKRMVDNKGGEYYIALYFDSFQNSWILSEKNSLTKINNPLMHNQGLVLILFYSAQINIGF
jgi:serine/threonine protein kinase